MIAHWKGIIEEIPFVGNIEGTSIFLPFFAKNIVNYENCQEPQNGSRNEKLLKIVNYQNCQKTILSQLEKVGGHQYPLGSISHYPLSAFFV
jgi:hypothetical protein